MIRKTPLWMFFSLAVMLFIQPASAGAQVTRTFDFFADEFGNGQRVRVNLMYYKKFGDHFKIIAFSPDSIDIADGKYTVEIPSRYYQRDYYLEIVFDAGFVTPRISLYPISEYIPRTAYIILGALFIALVSKIRFNRWTQKNAGKYAFPPRNFTTWSRFVRSSLAYVLVIEIFYFVIIFSPGTIVFIDKYLGGGHIDFKTLKEMGQYSVLWSIFLLTGVLPNFPWVSKWEHSLREMLHDHAFIPSEAKAVISQLDIHYTAFKPDDKIIQRILLKIGNEKFSEEDFRNYGGKIAHKWCKLSYLKYRLQDWITYPRINKFFEFSLESYNRFLSEYTRVKTEIDSYFQYLDLPGKQEDDNQKGLLAATESKLDAELNTLLSKAYSFICIGILGTEKMPRGRKKAFKYFGLEPYIPQRSFIDWDTNIKTIAAIVAATFFPTLFFYIMSTSGLLTAKLNYFPRNTQEALFWSIVGILMHGLTIIGVVFFDRWRTRVLTSMYDEEKTSSATIQNKLTKDVMAALIGFLIGFIIMVSLIALRHAGELDKFASALAENIHKYALWALLPAVTGYFVQYYLDTSLNPQKKPLHLALAQGGVMTATAALVSFIVIDQNLGQIWHFMIYAAFTAFFIGAGIGSVFPASYRKKMEKVAFPVERRASERKTIMEPATVYVDNEKYACNIVDISAEGARLDRAIRYPVGSKVQINAISLGKLNTIIVRKSKKITCVNFPYLDEYTRKRITAYFDQLVL